MSLFKKLWAYFVQGPMPGPGAPGTPIMSSPQGNNHYYQINFFSCRFGVVWC